MLRWLLRIIASIFLFIALVLLYLWWSNRDLPVAILEQQYGGENLQQALIEGVPVRYKVEGQGPALLLIHSHFYTMRLWQPWVEELSEHFTVIRYDLTSHGLTGPDPNGDYSPERTLAVVEKFIEAMDLENFSIGGTSMGGTVAIHYTHKYPERIQKLILLSPGSLEGKERKSGPRGKVPDAAYVLKYIMPRALPEFMLRGGFGDKNKLTDELVDRWYDMWMREGNREAQLDRLQQYKPGDIEDIIRQLQVPTLLMWGEANTTAKFEQAAEFQELLENVELLKYISYPGVGHMAVQEAGEATGRDVRAFLDGEFDAEVQAPRAEEST